MEKKTVISFQDKEEAALKTAPYIFISWLYIIQHLPCQVYAGQLYPYSHKTEAKLLFIETITFHYLTGSSLHQRKGHYMNLQEKEELLIFADKYTGQKCSTVKNVRSYLAQAFKPVPLKEAERIGLTQHNIIFATERDWRPAVENLGKKKWRYIHYE